MRISIAELTDTLVRALQAAGMDEGASQVARTIVLTEHHGDHHTGLAKLRAYVESLQSGWVDGKARHRIRTDRSGIVAVDAAKGFAHPLLERIRDVTIEKARSSGIALLAIRNSHHYSELWPDVLAYAQHGLVALAFLNSRSRMAPFGGRMKLFGTNPMAFACPRANGPPVVWDQASSVVSAMRLITAAQLGEEVPEGMGLDQGGEPTSDPSKIVHGGALLPFGGHKGSMIALMVEIMAAALTGGRFGFEDDSHLHPGAWTSNAGLTIIVIDPTAIAMDFADRVDQLCSMLAANGTARVPGHSRLTRMPQADDIVFVTDDEYAYARQVVASSKESPP